MATDKLLAGHRRFKERFVADHERFLRLAEEGQHPKVLWIGCSDSRVIPEQITCADPGELLIVRNIANVVPPFGPRGDAVGAAIEFAVLHLGVSDIVICGHTECGGIMALEHAVDRAREAHLARWLNLVRPALAQADVADESAEEQRTAIAKANVLLQRQNLRTYGCVQDAERARALGLHAWLYDLRTGDLLVFDDESRAWSSPVAPHEQT
jgi:carbonic anhydrase